MNDTMRDEYKAWQKVCATLRAAGIEPNSPMGSPACQVIDAIRDWGDKHADLKAQVKSA